MVEQRLNIIRKIPDLVIQRVPSKTNKMFKEFANEDFCNDYGMAFKKCYDDHLELSKIKRLLYDVNFLEIIKDEK